MGLGATRWVAPVEATREIVRGVLAAQPIEAEVFAHGRPPLAFSARCFTARHFNLQKEACEYRRARDRFPEGGRRESAAGEPAVAGHGGDTACVARSVRWIRKTGGVAGRELVRRLLAWSAGTGARRMKLLQLRPEALPAHALALALNAGFCFGLVSRSVLESLLGKTASLETSDLGTRVRVVYDGNRFKAYGGSAPTDLTIRSTVSGYLALRREDPDTLFFTRRLVMTGDTELGLVVKNALDAIHWPRLLLPRPRS